MIPKTISNGHHLLLKGMKKRPEYIWNLEWIKSIKNGECPECESPLNFKGKLLKDCKCSFYLLGSPETLAYTIKKSEKEPIHNYGFESVIEVCPECGNTSFTFDAKHAEQVCNCGMVINGPPSYSGYKQISYDSYFDPCKE